MNIKEMENLRGFDLAVIVQFVTIVDKNYWKVLLASKGEKEMITRGE